MLSMRASCLQFLNASTKLLDDTRAEKEVSVLPGMYGASAETCTTNPLILLHDLSNTISEYPLSNSSPLSIVNQTEDTPKLQLLPNIAPNALHML